VSALSQVLEHFRTHARTEREKGTYFEQLIQDYLLQADLHECRWMVTRTIGCENATKEKLTRA